ncbi:hypothetical protein KIW84_072752 [Lathyrus oleraceus]|uniref:Terpene synthase N-terminal domain-containing protein n=1 Tax=Pisum sativum TaxID=3888 RepID=A0A9D4VPE2_PEA|nr:hypothetical protein KIW84_072752 [Pisum sativum]
MIDVMQRLNIDYHFQEQIEAFFTREYVSPGYDLHETAFRFRLLRQQGHFVPSDIFLFIIFLFIIYYVFYFDTVKMNLVVQHIEFCLFSRNCKMARSFEKIVDKWIVITNNKEHFELVFIDEMYKIEIQVVNDGCRPIFVFWDSECSELLEISASQLCETMFEDGVDDPLEISLVLGKLLGNKNAFKVKWESRWDNASVMSVNHDKDTIQKLVAL